MGARPDYIWPPHFLLSSRLHARSIVCPTHGDWESIPQIRHSFVDDWLCTIDSWLWRAWGAVRRSRALCWPHLLRMKTQPHLHDEVFHEHVFPLLIEPSQTYQGLKLSRSLTLGHTYKRNNANSSRRSHLHVSVHQPWLGGVLHSSVLGRPTSLRYSSTLRWLPQYVQKL
jgi:hypothetical protein